jgi:hypothetical protein
MLNQMVIDKFIGCDTIVSRYNFNVDVTSDADIEYQSTKSGSVQFPTRFKVNRYWSGREDLKCAEGAQVRQRRINLLLRVAFYSPMESIRLWRAPTLILIHQAIFDPDRT